MNCTQAQAMIAAYREIKQGDPNTIELDRHLEECATCRQALARSKMVGESIRAFPIIEPPPELHNQLMQRLAAEHAKLMQQSAGTPAAPAFLKPYLHEHARHTHHLDTLAALSTAETGPLPILNAHPRRRRRPVMNQYAILGLVASFLILIMMGGLTSLLFITKGNPQIAGKTDSIAPPTNVIKEAYSTPTSYTHVASAAGNASAIYYTAYNNASQPQWMLMELNRVSKVSIPLLKQASTGSLLILGADNQHIIWIQLDPTHPSKVKNHLINEYLPVVQGWSLHELTLPQNPRPGLSVAPIQQTTLLRSTFSQATAPSWVHTPVQGIAFTPTSLLVSLIDEKGVSHLDRYQLNASDPTSTIQEVAQASHDHILTSPTSNVDGTQIFWSEEWEANSGILYSNIWTERTHEALPPGHGRWTTHMVTEKTLLMANGSSFRPTVVGNTLFWLTTTDITTATQGTPDASPTPTLSPTPVPTVDQTLPSNTDPRFYQAPADQAIRGALIMLPLDGDLAATPTTISTRGFASDLQGGTSFILCHNDTDYEMFDGNGMPVNVGSDLDQARVISVSGNTTVWSDISHLIGTPQSSSPTPEMATLFEYVWPVPTSR